MGPPPPPHICLQIVPVFSLYAQFAPAIFRRSANVTNQQRFVIVFGSIVPSLKRFRLVMVVFMAAFATALLAGPASAAVVGTEIDRNALLAIVVVGVLFLAIVVEVWRSALSNNAPIAPRATRHRTAVPGRHTLDGPF
jgi:hypothetical protein